MATPVRSDCDTFETSPQQRPDLHLDKMSSVPFKYMMNMETAMMKPDTFLFSPYGLNYHGFCIVF